MHNQKMLTIGRKLRRNQTDAEKILWQELKNSKLGVKFRRQMPFVFGQYHYLADFYCPEKKLIIEIDGSIHDNKENKRCDIFREEVFMEMGYNVIRFTNDEVENGMINIF